MKRLILVRHAKSSWKDPGLVDRDRPLNGRGRRDAPEMGRRLAARDVAPDVLVTSPARRARKTARKIADALGYPRDGILEEETVYEASLPDLLAVVRGLDPDWDEVLLVGHNPGLTDLANFLLPGRPFVNLPTCGVACVDLPVDGWDEAGEGAGRLVFHDAPRLPGPPG